MILFFAFFYERFPTIKKSNLKNKKREKLLDAMFVTIAGIAAAMKNTG